MRFPYGSRASVSTECLAENHTSAILEIQAVLGQEKVAKRLLGMSDEELTSLAISELVRLLDVCARLEQRVRGEEQQSGGFVVHSHISIAPPSTEAEAALLPRLKEILDPAGLLPPGWEPPNREGGDA